jgi:hypothetical protein
MVAMKLPLIAALFAVVASCESGSTPPSTRPDVPAVPDVPAPDATAPDATAPDATALDVIRPTDTITPTDTPVAEDARGDVVAAPDAAACASTLRVASSRVDFFWVGQATEVSTTALRWEGAPCEGVTAETDAPWMSASVAGS